MTKIALRITRDKDFLPKIIAWASKFKYIAVHEIGSLTQKPHFHLYIETDMRIDNFVKLQWNKFRKEHNLVGNEDASKTQRPPKTWNYLMKGEVEGTLPEYDTNFPLTESEVRAAHDDYWRYKKNGDFLEKVTLAEKVESEVESDVARPRAESEAITIWALKLQIEQERTSRKAVRKPTKPDFLTYLEESYEKESPLVWTNSRGDPVPILVKKWIQTKMVNARKATLLYPRVIDSYANFFIIKYLDKDYIV